MTELQELKLTRKDFISDQEVRWCPGCGDYAILSQVQKVMPELGIPRENIVFISGIGCSSRFPYYMETYGMHSIHGRAPTVATGLRLANPNLKVFVITGDGDGLSIGGNHLLHLMRRNVNVTVILFNNRIYGLTKGQYSPTSLPGTKTKSSPLGSIEPAFNPISIALSAEATFVARTVDTHVNHLATVIKRAAEHNGTAFVEVLQNCVIFNDGTWDIVTNPNSKKDNSIELNDGEKMIFGKSADKGIRWTGYNLEVVTIGENGITYEDLLTHDSSQLSPALAFALSRMEYPEFPVPLGVFRQVSRPTYEESLFAQLAQGREKQGPSDLRKLFLRGDTWNVNSADEATLDHLHGGDMPLEASEAADAYIETLGQRLLDPSNVAHSLLGDTLATLVLRTPIVVDPDTDLTTALNTMRQQNIGCLLITDTARRLIGIFTERDVLNKVPLDTPDLAADTVRNYMTPNPRSLPADAPIAYAVSLMAHHGFRHVPIVDAEHRPIGIISFRDVVHFIEQYFN